MSECASRDPGRISGCRPYRFSKSDQKRLDEQIEQLLKHSLIRRSFLSYSFPITLVDKKTEGKKSRLCIDYQKLNKITIPDNFPSPWIEDIIDRLSDSNQCT